MFSSPGGAHGFTVGWEIGPLVSTHTVKRSAYEGGVQTARLEWGLPGAGASGP